MRSTSSGRQMKWSKTTRLRSAFALQDVERMVVLAGSPPMSVDVDRRAGGSLGAGAAASAFFRVGGGRLTPISPITPAWMGSPSIP
jgi:hypothetical protein